MHTRSHGAVPHVPPLQYGLGPVQALPHVPQLWMSLLGFTHAPLQQRNEAWHLHCPPELLDAAVVLVVVVPEVVVPEVVVLVVPWVVVPELVVPVFVVAPVPPPPFPLATTFPPHPAADKKGTTATTPTLRRSVLMATRLPESAPTARARASDMTRASCASCAQAA
jgi:hypothetical protein